MDQAVKDALATALNGARCVDTDGCIRILEDAKLTADLKVDGIAGFVEGLRRDNTYFFQASEPAAPAAKALAI